VDNIHEAQNDTNCDESMGSDNEYEESVKEITQHESGAQSGGRPVRFVFC
jgi:hypothetical protein